MTIEEYIVDRLNHLEFENTKLKNDKEKLKNKVDFLIKTIRTFESLLRKANINESEYWFRLNFLDKINLTDAEVDILRELISQEKEAVKSE